MGDEQVEEVAEEVDAEEGVVAGIGEVELADFHVGFGEVVQGGEDEPGLVEGAEPGVEVDGGEDDLLVGQAGEVAGDGVAGAGKEMVKFGGGVVVPIGIGGGIVGDQILKEALVGTRRGAFGEDVGDFVEAMGQDGVNVADADRFGVHGFHARDDHRSAFSSLARSW